MTHNYAVLPAQLTFNHEFGFGCVLPNFNAVGALILHGHLLYHQFMAAIVDQDVHSIGGIQLRTAFIPDGTAAR